MEREIELFIDKIKEKIDIDISVFNAKGESLNGGAESVPANFNGVFSDVGLKRTLFKVKYKNDGYIFKLCGCGKAERNYAYLISELAEKSQSKELNLTREEFYKAVLRGEISYYQTEKYVKKYSVSKNPVCVMLIDVEAGRQEEVANVISNYGSDSSDMSVILDDGKCAFIKFSDEEVEEYHSFMEYAEFLWQSILEETAMDVCISVGGTVNSFINVSVSLSQALVAERMAKNVYNQSGVHSFKEYTFTKMLEDLPKYKLNEYLESLLDDRSKEIFNDKEMVSTAEEFLENSLNISETSRKLYLHRNTLTYRLDKIEKETGLNIRRFSDAVTFRLIMTLSKLVK